MKRPSLYHLLAALLFSVVATLPFMPFASDSAPRHRFEAVVTSTQFGVAQLFYDKGEGISERDSIRLDVEPGAPRTLHFALSAGTYRGLRLDPTDRPGVITIVRAAILAPDGALIRSLPAASFRTVRGIETTTIGPAGELTVTPIAGEQDPILEISMAGELVLPSTEKSVSRVLLFTTFPAFMVTLLALTWIPRWGGSAIRLPGRGWWQDRPFRQLALASALAVAASNYPVVFLGKSFASPNFGATLLYETTPTLPGLRDKRVEDVKGSDVGPLFWQNMTHAMIQRDALLAGEWPLWFRYNSAGTELLGQGQSMFGDPLHFLVVAASGSAWAWDAKFLIAKWLLAFGLGVLAFRTSGHLRGALIVAASAAFFGFFSFRINHPAYFSFCYSPWILLAWLELKSATHLRSRLIAGGWLLLATWTEINSGTAKEAYMLMLGLNATGALIVLLSQSSWRNRLLSLATAAGSGVVLVLLSAPIWLTFLDALKASYTSYNAPSAWQIHPSFLLGLFDELFYRPLQPSERVSNPSANFIILGGVLYLAATWRACAPGRTATALALACIPSAVIAFGVIPPQWIQTVPFLGNVAHVDNCFSLILIIQLSVLAAFGFKAADERLGTAAGRGDLVLCLILFAALSLPWISSAHTVHKPLYPDGERFTLHSFGETLAIAPFIWISLPVLAVSLALGGWVIHRSRTAGMARGPATLSLITIVTILLFRHGQHVGSFFSDYIVNPPSRPSLLARSEAVEAVRADMKTPKRAVGIEGNLFPGWAAAYRFEGISGPEALMNPYFRELAEALGLDRVWDWRIMIHSSDLGRMRKPYDLLNIGYYLDYRSDQGKIGALLTPLRMADLDVYRSETVWPRAFFTDRLATYGDVRDFARLVAEGDGRPFAAMESKDPRPDFLRTTLSDRQVVPAADYFLTPNTTRFVIDAPAAGIAVLTEAWQDRNFEALLDGKAVPYLRLNHAFKGIVIPTPGRHVIEFTYSPRRFNLALSLSGFGLGLLLLATGTIWRLGKVSPDQSKG